MGACVAWIDDGHSTRPMVLAAFPEVAITHGTTQPRLYFFHPAPCLPKTIVASCADGGHSMRRPTLRPYRAAHISARPWSPLRMNCIQARGRELLRGTHSELPPPTAPLGHTFPHTYPCLNRCFTARARKSCMQLRVQHVAPPSAQRGTLPSPPRGNLRYGYRTPPLQCIPRLFPFAQSAPSALLVGPDDT